jgi:hypothetical protein
MMKIKIRFIAMYAGPVIKEFISHNPQQNSHRDTRQTGADSDTHSSPACKISL